MKKWRWDLLAMVAVVAGAGMWDWKAGVCALAGVMALECHL